MPRFYRWIAQVACNSLGAGCRVPLLACPAVSPRARSQGGSGCLQPGPSRGTPVADDQARSARVGGLIAPVEREQVLSAVRRKMPLPCPDCQQPGPPDGWYAVVLSCGCCGCALSFCRQVWTRFEWISHRQSCEFGSRCSPSCWRVPLFALLFPIGTLLGNWRLRGWSCESFAMNLAIYRLTIGPSFTLSHWRVGRRTPGNGDCSCPKVRDTSGTFPATRYRRLLLPRGLESLPFHTN